MSLSWKDDASENGAALKKDDCKNSGAYSMSWENETPKERHRNDIFSDDICIKQELVLNDISKSETTINQPNVQEKKEPPKAEEPTKEEPKPKNRDGLKVLIWIACFLPYILSYASYGNIGAIPSMILVGGGLVIAKSLCKKLDKRN